MLPSEIENTLRSHLASLLPHHPISDVYEYATLPGGKLFRPCLVWAILSDLDKELYNQSILSKTSPHALLASSVEFHHSYTLLHDDLPCMDDDTIRRGKACTHLVYGQWQALLAGDGLLNLSYQLLSKINHPRALELIRFYSWALGPKGLIHGQVLDLSHEMTNSIKTTVFTHELKTARLIQASILGSAMLTNSKNIALEKKLWRFSKLLGINFQLIDDLSELSTTELSVHETDVNPWLLNAKETFSITQNLLEAFHTLSVELQLTNTNKIISEYLGKMLTIISTNQQTIDSHLQEKIDLLPIILLMKNFR